MNHALKTVLAALSLATALAAQDAPADAPPNPKTPQHDRLTALVGTWRTETKMAAMPGVPGMEKPSEIVGTEHAELICNGLWLKVTGEGTCDGQESSCWWLVGYDPHAKSYQCIVASSTDDAACSLEASYDEKTKTWHFHGDSPMGPFRSEFVMESADRSIEKSFAKGPDGKETEFMRTVRTRVKGTIAKAAATAQPIAGATNGADMSASLAALHADCGTWDADFKMEMPGMPAMTAKCREVIAPICGGKWTWSDFRGDIMGAPFEGHALVGFDSKADRIVSFWFDSMSGACMRTDGKRHPKMHAMNGTSYDEQGQRIPVTSTTTVTDKDTRTMRMLFGDGAGQRVLTIAYRRAAK